MQPTLRTQGPLAFALTNTVLSDRAGRPDCPPRRRPPEAACHASGPRRSPIVHLYLETLSRILRGVATGTRSRTARAQARRG